ncbi:hypothetical protein CG51_14030 [Haematobacter missouriensis]|nr:hypothetical protein CG51_14030 [Haematobacter missouriensis]
MTMWRILSLLLLCVTLTACGSQSKFKSYDGPEVTSIQVHKSQRKMYLLHDNIAIKTYDIGLGPQPLGHKQISGDGRTPEGLYFIDRRNPNSQYHLSVGISYPNPHDVEVARALGLSPGGDIFIHGEAGWAKGRARDWTAGCIAVTDKEIEEIYSMVREGTPIYLLP